jgi:hypothetical protein
LHIVIRCINPVAGFNQGNFDHVRLEIVPKLLEITAFTGPLESGALRTRMRNMTWNAIPNEHYRIRPAQLDAGLSFGLQEFTGFSTGTGGIHPGIHQKPLTHMTPISDSAFSHVIPPSRELITNWR